MMVLILVGLELSYGNVSAQPGTRLRYEAIGPNATDPFLEIGGYWLAISSRVVPCMCACSFACPFVRDTILNERSHAFSSEIPKAFNMMHSDCGRTGSSIKGDPCAC